MRNLFKKSSSKANQSSATSERNSLRSLTKLFRNSSTPPSTESLDVTPQDDHQTTSLSNELYSKPAESTMKENLGIVWRFTQTLITKMPEIVDGNPAKMAFSLATAIIETKNAVGDNKDAVCQQIESTGAHLTIVAEALADWTPKNADEKQWISQFNHTLVEELKNLHKLRDEWPIRKVVDYQHETKRIAEIFEHVNQARVQFELATGIRVFKIVHAIQEELRGSLLDRLRASHIADHKYHLVGKQREVLRRTACTPGTRVRILGDIIKWANDISPESPTIYWLSGLAGSGKSTIAYTIARRFELTVDVGDTIVLGGNFFCSRQFEETRYETHIVRTIAYHLALTCKAFAEALSCSGKFDAVNQNVRAQLEGLLIGPWQASESARCPDPSTPPPNYLVVIDALDEIDGKGGSDFLFDLLDVIHANRLKGLKFFVTSRPNPDLVTHVGSFGDKQLYRLEEVPFEEAQDDIRTYLNASLPNLAGRDEVGNLVTLADGLFIYAATVVKHLDGCARSEQRKLLLRLFSGSQTVVPQTSLRATFLLDQLYFQILSDAFDRFEDDILTDRLRILYTFLCTAERTATSTVANLLFTADPDETEPDTEIVNKVVMDLYAVLYTENDSVLSYHKSFTDFMFDQSRSNKFWCNQVAHHRLLTESCFRIMDNGLTFNIAKIPSSFILDRDNSTLSTEVERNIPPVLSYSCRNWDHHLSAVASTDRDPLHHTLSDFLQLRALFWIEAMNLLGTRGLCDPMLRTASEWVRKDLALASNFVEAANFAVYFSASPASLSTPHLYISALATWPRNSDPCRGWRDSFPTIPAFINAVRQGGSLLLMTLKSDSCVNAVAVSSDGRRIVSGSCDKLVRVWDASTGEVLKVLDSHTESVRSVAFSSDGNRIVSGSEDQSVKVWDASTGKELKALHGHTGWVWSVAFSSDGMIGSGSEDQSVRVWDATTGKALKVLVGHTGEVLSVAFSGDGSQIVSGSSDSSVRVWDVSTGKVLMVLDCHIDLVWSVALSGDGRQIVAGSSNKTVRVWDASTGEVLKVLAGHTDSVRSVAFSSDGSRIVSGSSDRSVRVWDVSTGKVLMVLDGHTSWVNSVALSSDSGRIVSGSSDKSLSVWDASTGEVMKVLDGHTDSVRSVAFSSDGSRIVSGSFDNSTRVWDASTGEVLKVLDDSSRVRSVAFSSDGRRIVSGSSKLVKVWDASTGEVLKVLAGHTNKIPSVAFSSDGSRIVSGSSDTSVRVWDASTGEELKVLAGHSHSVWSVAFSSDGTLIASGSTDRLARVWDASTGEVLKVLHGHEGSVLSVAFSSDGRIVSGSFDNSVRVWDAATGEVLKVLAGHTDPVWSVAFSSDGTRIVSGSSDKSVREWDATTGKMLKVLDSHTGEVLSVAFSSDDRRIVSGSKAVQVWDTSMKSRYILEHNGVDLRRYTGWLLSPSGEGYLMFVPLDARLPDSSNLLTMPHSAVSAVDFTRANLGSRWHDCYRS